MPKKNIFDHFWRPYWKKRPQISGQTRAWTSCIQFACDRLAFQNVGSQLNYAHAFFFHFFDKVKNKNFIITIMRFGRAIIDFNRAAVWAEAWDNARGILLHLML